MNGESDQVPTELLDMVRGRIGHQPLDAVATIRTTRVERDLLDAAGARLAVVADDIVHARRSRHGSVDLLEWREIEVELDRGGDRAARRGDGAVPERRIDAGRRSLEAPPGAR